MASELKERREQGSHLMTMSKELERTDNEKAKLERRLQRRTDQLKKKNEASFTGALMGSFFGGVLGASREVCRFVHIRADVTKGIRGYVTVNLCECPRMSAYRRISNPRICEYLCEL